MAIGIPVLMLVLFGYALTLDVDNVPHGGLGPERHAGEPRTGQPILPAPDISRCGDTSDN